MAIVITYVCICLMATGVAEAQAPDDPVHVSPLELPSTVAPEEVPGRGGFSRLHPKPMRVDVDLVLVPVTVTDTMNHPVTGLDKEQFAVYEDEQQQALKYFGKEDGPISIGIIVDLSGSMSNKIEAVRRAVSEFFAAANPDDDYFVITFSDRPALLADSTQSIGTIESKLALATAHGRTSLLDAIYLGLNKIRTAQYQRRALLIVSDGGDNHSRYRAKEIKQMVEEADVQIYAIGIFDTFFRTPEERDGKRLLEQITEATGGRTITIRKPGRELPVAASTISWELRSQYVLGYRPTNTAPDGRYRKIRVRLTRPTIAQPLQLYYKHGYLAEESSPSRIR